MNSGPEIQVSVVIAAYNSPPELDDLVASLDAQSLPDECFEVIFVDDGSSDDTLDRLRGLARERAYMSVHTIPNSGWPGRPRNVGTAAARGEYVFFADHDDYLFPEALERMIRFARENQLDVVHPKEVVQGWSGPGWSAWRNEVPRINGWDPTTVQCITPHKLYRKAFLEEQGIRFPEGKVRLEDFSFNALAWAATDAVGIFSSYPCYRWMVYEDNSHKKGFDFDSYWNDFEESLQPLLQLPDASDKQDQLLLRWYRSRVLERLAGIYSTYTDSYRGKLNAKFTELLRYFPPHLDGLLSAADRLRSTLLRDGEFEALLALSEADRGMRLEMRATDVRWAEGVLRISGTGLLVDREGDPVRFHESADGGLVRALPDIVDRALPASVKNVSEDLKSATPQVVIRDRTDNVDWFIPSRGSVTVSSTGDAKAVGFEFTADLDPQTAAFGRPLGSAVWDVFARFPEMGYTATHRLQVETVEFGAALHHGRQAVAYRTKPGYLALDLGSTVRTVVGTAQPTESDISHGHDNTEILLRRVHVAGDTSLDGHIETPSGQIPARLENRGSTAKLIVQGAPSNLIGSRAVFGGRRSAGLLTGPAAATGAATSADSTIPPGRRPQIFNDLVEAGQIFAKSPSGARVRAAWGRMNRLARGRR